jgi:hypothetical protein
MSFLGLCRSCGAVAVPLLLRLWCLMTGADTLATTLRVVVAASLAPS